MPIKDCADARSKQRILEFAIDQFWILSFFVGAAVGVASILLTASVAGALAAVGLTVVAGVGMGLLYKKLSDALTKVKDWIAANC